MANWKVALKSRLKGTPLGKYLRRRQWNKGILDQAGIMRRIDHYMPDASAEEKARTLEDILDMARKYRFSAEEYFYYHFADRDEAERATFVSDLNRIDFCETLNKFKNLAIFDDKMRSYEVFGDYYGRDCCCVNNQRDTQSFLTFVKKHSRFMLKPLTGTCGKGIRIVTLDENDLIRQAEAVVAEFFSGGSNDGFIAEELIVQVPEMEKFNPDSVNTVRISVVRFDEGCEPIAAFFRTGRKGSIVDNAGSGGVFGNVDVQTGRIFAVGDEFGNLYDAHPDSGYAMKGFTIPRWDEAVALAKQLSLVIPDNRYTGWDLALTEKGWLMIEGNSRGQFVWQIPSQTGWLKDMNGILRRLGKKEMTKLGVRA
ncbi:MAG: hypothetical protein IKK75_03235 [Clostridia bacterium]|nr:hypothetical protein [Clostridia bacterium]